MANRNHLGPNNEGSMTGRGLGDCNTDKKATTTEKVGQAAGAGMALGRGLGRGLGLGQGGGGRKGFSVNRRGNNNNSNK